MQVTSIEADGGKVTGVSLSDGRHLPADLVVVGVGVAAQRRTRGGSRPAGARPASSSTTHLATADPDISAIGDCALYASPRFGGSLRLESVQNATDHARCVAARLTGDAKPYDGLPWFWSDQGPDKLQMVGLTTGYDQVVVRGDRGAGAFSAFCYKQRAAARHRIRQPRRRSHVRPASARGQPLDHAGAGGRYQLRPEGRAGLTAYAVSTTGVNFCSLVMACQSQSIPRPGTDGERCPPALDPSSGSW